MLLPEDDRTSKLAGDVIALLNARGLTNRPVVLYVAPDEYEAVEGEGEIDCTWAVYTCPVGNVDPVIEVISPTAWARLAREDGMSRFAYAVAYEYMHHVQWARGDAYDDEEEADEFAAAFLKEIGV